MINISCAMLPCRPLPVFKTRQIHTHTSAQLQNNNNNNNKTNISEMQMTACTFSWLPMLSKKNYE